MGAGYRYGAVVAARDDAQHHRALDGGDAFLFSCDQLGVVALDGGCVYDQLGTLDILGAVTHMHGDAVALDAVEGLALVAVRAGELKALAVKYLGERAHTRAADADKVDALYVI